MHNCQSHGQPISQLAFSSLTLSLASLHIKSDFCRSRRLFTPRLDARDTKAASHLHNHTRPIHLDPASSGYRTSTVVHINRLCHLISNPTPVLNPTRNDTNNIQSPLSPPTASATRQNSRFTTIRLRLWRCSTGTNGASAPCGPRFPS